MIWLCHTKGFKLQPGCSCANTGCDWSSFIVQFDQGPGTRSSRNARPLLYLDDEVQQSQSLQSQLDHTLQEPLDCRRCEWDGRTADSLTKPSKASFFPPLPTFSDVTTASSKQSRFDTWFWTLRTPRRKNSEWQYELIKKITNHRVLAYPPPRLPPPPCQTI